MSSQKNAVTLTKDQKTQLRKLEDVIRKAQTAFLQSSLAILEIERQRLYLPHRSISAYCFVRWDMSAPEVSRCRQAALVLETLKKDGFEELPSNESQARALAHLEAKDQVKAWKAVLAKGDKITAALIRKVVAELFGEDEPQQKTPPQEPPKNKVDTPIDLQPIIFGLETIQTEIPKNKLTLKDKETLRKQLKAAEELLAKIKKQIG